MKKVHVFFFAVLFITACQSTSDKDSENAFIKIEGIDSSLNPGDNFFLYANKIWLDTAQIPPSQSGVGAYMFMNYPQRLRLQNILDSVSQSTNKAGTLEQKIGDFYASGMDTVTINARGFEPLKPILNDIDNITDIPSMMKFVASQMANGNMSIISFYVYPDNKNSSLNIGHVMQTGIGLPERDYYFKSDPHTIQVQNAYKKAIATFFVLTGTDVGQAGKEAEIVYNIEKQLASAHKTNVELRDIQANYNKMAVSALANAQPNIGWKQLLQNLNLKTDTLDVSQPAYYAKLNALLKSVPISDWKTYLKGQTIAHYSDKLSRPFVDVRFDYIKVVTGQEVQKTRGETIASEVDGALGEALGQLYVKKYFSENAKKRMLELVNNLEKAFETRINKLDWMSDSTKFKAIEKLHSITKKIGYPDKWRDYGNVNIVRDQYFENIVACDANNYQYNLAKLNKPVDRSEWFTTPSTVTAYYNPSGNEIVFPAGILQAPYFDDAADDALNYGGIGMVIGHEMTHAFDDQGAQFDKDGNVTNWWTKEDYEKFKAKTGQVINLYNSFTVLDTVHLKGTMTVGENTADIGGVAIAYDAFKLTNQGKDTVRLGGLTPDQRFFFSIARIWRVKMKDEFMRLWVNNNPHALPMWRVNGPLMNSTHFYKAFDIKPTDKMYLPDSARIHIW